VVAPTTAPPVLLTVEQLTRQPEQWVGQDITLVAPVAGNDRRVLSSYLIVSTEGVQPPTDADLTIWLAEPLPITVTRDMDEAGSVLRLRGRLSPPGAYGPDGSLPYQFSAEQAMVTQPETSTVAAVAANPHALDRVLLQIEGILLTTSDGALLTDQITEGGVPTADAQQIKLPDLPAAQIPASLRQSGAVRYGHVEVVGWWQDRTLTPFIIRAARPEP
jgi:hypothetical protein